MSHSEAKKVLKYIKRGSISKLRSFLKRSKVNLNEIRDSENRGVLHLSCYLGECKMTRFLLRYGADPCMIDNEGNTPMHIALKYALEYNNETVFLNLVLPLKKKSKRVMNLANKIGETPNEMLHRLKKALKRELSDKDELSDKNWIQEENEKFSTQRQEQEWYEKLAFEETCEDFYFKQDTYDSLSEEQSESYNEWADRIRREYRTKHQKVLVTNSRSQKQKDFTVDESLTEKLAKEHKEYIDIVKLKRIKREKSKYEQNCLDVFECGAKDELTFQAIPWPCAGSAADIVDKLSQWAGEDISYLKVQRVRWHPDKFSQRCGHRLKDVDKEQILDLVKQISQGINFMISSMK
ncbi:NF-kappa-B inhibitor-like protein 1 [Dendronephthya gigantea]|uniref:NF-kappa-B inhibitor-like protein 1 n=1 Tax=Dendronephthya gigantea TaxID=151771 RepID=UPI001068EBDF|nr:NF-kappa-B inhibitor-like protein 1 [Dendronephthya gigantea]